MVMQLDDQGSALLDAQMVLDALAGWEEVEARLPLDEDGRRRRGAWVRQSGGFDETFLLRAIRHPRAVYRIVAMERGGRFASVVEQGLRDPYWRVRWTAATCELADSAMLAELAHDTSCEVRRRVASNPCMPLAALRQLLEDPVAAVRHAAAGHDSLTESDLRRLARHTDWETRRIIASRNDTPVDVLDVLAADRNPKVADAVGSNEHASTEALHRVVRRTRNHWTRTQISLHPNTAIEDLLFLADGGDRWVLDAMAKHCTVPEVLYRLSQRDDAVLRAALLTNQALPTEALAVMPLEAPVAEHRGTARHPNATWHTCRRLAGQYLASKHHGRRLIGVELVQTGLAKPDAPDVSSSPSLAEPVDVVVAVLLGHRRDELAAWVDGPHEPTWLRTYVRSQLGL